MKTETNPNTVKTKRAYTKSGALSKRRGPKVKNAEEGFFSNDFITTLRTLKGLPAIERALVFKLFN